MLSELKITLEAARVNAGYSQKEAARKLHVDPFTLRSWEKGKTSPTLKKARELEALYGISLDYIFLPYNLANGVKKKGD